MPEPRDAAEVRRRILERAAALFQRRGVSAVTMDEIAASLAMSKKTLYQHFARKEDLAAAVIERAFDELERDLLVITEGEGGDFGARLRRYMETVAERYRRTDGPLLDDLARGYPELWARFGERSRQTVERGFGRLFAAGVAAGELRGDLNPSMVALLVQGMSQMIASPTLGSTTGAPVPSPSERFAVAFDILLNGIRVRPEAAPGPARSASRPRSRKR